MSQLPIAYQEIIGPLIEQARRILEQGESLVPVAFVGSLIRKEILPVMLQTDGSEAKDASAAVIRRIAEESQADFVFVMTEAWSLPSDQAHAYAEIIEEFGSIGDSPYRLDVISFTLETPHGLWVAQAPICAAEVADAGRTFAIPTFQHFGHAQGRLTELLPGRDPSPGSLH